MSELSDKVRHVLNEEQTRPHSCHWPKCGRQVPPAMWGCKRHWFRLPIKLRNAIWAAYTIGQEKGDTEVSDEYFEAVRAAERWALRWEATHP